MDSEFVISGTTVSVDSLLKLQLMALDLRRLSSVRTHSKRAGDQRSVYRGQGREFVELKHYQTGDDVRQIDWRQTAKKQTPFVKVMEEDRHSEQAIWLDLSSSCYFGTQRCFKSVMACHWAAFLVWRFLHLHHPLRLFIRVGNHWQKELKILSIKQGAAACALIAEAHQVLAEQIHHTSNPQGGSVHHWTGRPNLWFISDFLEHREEDLRSDIPTSKFSSVNFLQILDSFDYALPNAGVLPVAHQNNKGWINTENETLTHALHTKTRQRQQWLEAFAWENRGNFLSHLSNEFQWQEVQQWPLYH